MRFFVLNLLFYLMLVPAGLAQIDPGTARQYFDDVQQILEADGGSLWGKPLGGPILFVDPATRAIVASSPDQGGLLERQGEVFTGSYPADRPLANTAVDWSGTRWAMIAVLSPEATREARNVLLIHELWHRVQDELGFPLTNPANDHLESVDGRIWLQLELRALASALAQTGASQRQAVTDALLFRANRHSLFDLADGEERALENHEGLAEYTGITLAIDSRADRKAYAIRALESAADIPSFSRTFAYLNVPSYGLLLDVSNPAWTRSFTPNDSVAEQVRLSLDIELPVALADAALRRSDHYGAADLIASENARELERQRRIAGFRQRFVTDPYLLLPLEAPQMSFDPRAVTQIDGIGRVYDTLEVSDAWGTLTVTGGALLSADWRTVIVDLPDDPTGDTLMAGPYILKLADGWRIVAGAQPGQLTVSHDKSSQKTSE
jgi:hypothetical protein